MRIASSLVLGALVSTLAFGCDSEEDPQPPPTLSVEATPTEISSGDSVTLKFTIENFTLSGEHDHAHLEAAFDPDLAARPDPLEAEDVAEYDGPREGHVHVYLDDFETNPIGMLTVTEAEVVVEAEPGTHTLLCRLHGSDHKIIEPQVIDSVELTVN
jgi:hypothetical protein